MFKPKSPYGIAKASAHWQVVNYREAYNLFAVNGILFNHESPLRPDRFVTKKVVKAVSDIANGKLQKLEVGNIDIVRDWGWAPDYVEAMWLMLQQENPDDFVISTGVGHSLREFIQLAFKCANLEMDDYLIINQLYFRPTDLQYVVGSPQKAKNILGWSSNRELEWIVNEMYSNKINF